MNIKEELIKLMDKFPHVNNMYREGKEYRKNCCYSPGHYYSPIVLIDDIKKRECEIWGECIKKEISGIDLRVFDQIELINNLSKYYPEIPFKPEKQFGVRYYLDNEFYNYTDGIILYSMIRHLKPERIIEIGSGFSSALMLDTNEMFFDNKIDLCFIEPYTERLLSLMSEADKAHTAIIQNDAQSISLEIFQNLKSGDILFIDSTHVVKTGSDVNYILFEILPSLQSGVLIHFHDIFYPFEYPKEWVFKGRNWNEDYFLKALLMYNSSFEIKLFSDYIHKCHKDAFKNMPLTYMNTGGSIWIMKN
jgi:predicted O-methyltransferase YrrM